MNYYEKNFIHVSGTVLFWVKIVQITQIIGDKQLRHFFLILRPKKAFLMQKMSSLRHMTDRFHYIFWKIFDKWRAQNSMFFWVISSCDSIFGTINHVFLYTKMFFKNVIPAPYDCESLGENFKNIDKWPNPKCLLASWGVCHNLIVLGE